jgi:hypothetical protein
MHKVPMANVVLDVVAESAVSSHARKRDRAIPHFPRSLSSWYFTPRHASVTNVPDLPRLWNHRLIRANCRPSTTMADEKSTEYVTLVSNDGYEFKILRAAACIAGTIKKALDPMCTYNLTH